MAEMELVTRFDPAVGYEVPMLVPTASGRIWTEEEKDRLKDALRVVFNMDDPKPLESAPKLGEPGFLQLPVGYGDIIRTWTEEEIEEAAMMAEISENQFESLFHYLKARK